MIGTFLDQNSKLRHPFYKIMELEIEALQSELQSWERSELIAWSCWNDKNGVYGDDQSIREFGNILEKNEAIKIITTQIHNTN